MQTVGRGRVSPHSTASRDPFLSPFPLLDAFFFFLPEGLTAKLEARASFSPVLFPFFVRVFFLFSLFSSWRRRGRDTRRG